MDNEERDNLKMEVQAAMHLADNIRKRIKELEDLTSDGPGDRMRPDQKWIPISWAMDLEQERNNLERIEEQIRELNFDY
jgi:hypothetical protein